MHPFDFRRNGRTKRNLIDCKHRIPARALVGIHENDTQKDIEYCAKKLLGCKLWQNDAGSPWRHGARTKGLEILCVSQFTLYGKLTKKNQPDYKASMKAIPAKAIYENFLELLKSQYEPDKIQDGVFGAMMDVGKEILLCSAMYNSVQVESC